MFKTIFQGFKQGLYIGSITGVLLCLSQVSFAGVYGPALGTQAKYASGKQSFAYVNPQAPKGGMLRLGVQGDFDTLNPFLLKGSKLAGAEAFGDSLLLDTLMTESWDEPFAMYGLLAQDIALAQDGLSVTFTLNPKARFSNGDAVLAQDVVASFKTLTTDEAASPFYRFYYADVKDVVAVSERAVRFDFAKKNAELHLILGQFPIFSHKSYPDGLGKAATVLPIGSGPYLLERFEYNRLVQYQRRSDYWADALPIRQGFWNFDQVRFRYYRDPTTYLEALKAAQFDVSYENSAKNWARSYNNPSLYERGFVKKEFAHSNNAGLQAYVMNTRRAPLDDRTLRQALALSFDFETINQQMFYGLYTRSYSYFSNSELAATGMISDGERQVLKPLQDKLRPEVLTQAVPMPAVVSPVLGVRPNLLLARTLLLQGGYRYQNGQLLDKQGKPIVLEFLTNAKTFERVSAKWQRDLAKLGITLRLRLVDSAIYQKRVQSFDYDIITHNYGQSQSPGNEQAEMHSCAAAQTPSSRNRAGTCNEAIDALLKRFEHFETRQELVDVSRALDRVLRHEYYVVPQWYSDQWRMVYWDKFEQAQPLPLYYDPISWPLKTWWSKSAP